MVCYTAFMKLMIDLGEYYIKPVEEEELDLLQKVFEKSNDYFEEMTGLPAYSSAALTLSLQLPEGKVQEDKFYLGIYKRSLKASLENESSSSAYKTTLCQLRFYISPNLDRYAFTLWLIYFNTREEATKSNSPLGH